MKPLHQHDCDECQFLGQNVERGTVYDLYYCPPQDTYIARHGVDGEYGSCSSVFAHRYEENTPIGQAVALHKLGPKNDTLL